MMNILAFGDLITTGEYGIQTRFKNHINFSSRGKLLTLTDRLEDAGPLNLVMNSLDFAPPRNLVVKSDSIKFNQRTLYFHKTGKYNSNLEITFQEFGNILAVLDHLQKFVLEKGSTASLKYLLQDRDPISSGAFQKELLKTVRKGFHVLLAGNINRGVAGIKGRGFGLTPSGDDLLTGLLYGLHLIQFQGINLNKLRSTILAASCTENLISRNYLRLAFLGSYFADLKRLILAIISGDFRVIDRNLSLYLRKGETSGSDLMTGLLLALVNRKKLIVLNK